MSVHTLTPQRVNDYFTEKGLNLADAYAVLLVEAGHQVELPTVLLQDAAARVLCNCLTVLHERVRVAYSPLEMMRLVGDPNAFAWSCLRAHVARLTPLPV